MVSVGDQIKIINMVGESDYSGKIGYVTRVDDLGQIHGTWGGCAIIPEKDTFVVLQKAK